MEKIKQNPFVKKVGFNRVVLCFVLILLYGFFCAMTQGDFAGISRILSALNYAYFLGFLSLGVTFVIATGGIDFSIGPVMFCCSTRSQDRASFNRRRTYRSSSSWYQCSGRPCVSVSGMDILVAYMGLCRHSSTSMACMNAGKGTRHLYLHRHSPSAGHSLQ